MGYKTYVTVTPKKGTVIVGQKMMITEEVQIGNTKKFKKRKRQIQYVDTLDTIYVDEQREIMGGETPDPSPLYLSKGKLSVNEDNSTLIKYMDIHSDNKANGGNVFRLLDVAKEDLFEVENFAKTSEVSSKVMNGEEKMVRSIAVWFLGVKYVKLDINKVKKALYLRCQSDYKFVEEIEKFMKDKTNDQKLLITVALTENIITIVDGKKICWHGTEEALYIGTQPKDLVSEFSIWLKTDKDGRETLKTIISKIEKNK